MTLTASRSNDENLDHCVVSEEQLEPIPVPKHKGDSIATALLQFIADEVKSQVANALATIPDMFREAILPLSDVATGSVQEGSVSWCTDP